MEDLHLFAVIAASIVAEGAPFLLLGAFLGALFEVLATDALLARLSPRSALGQAALGFFGGLVLPTCECGAAPLARRMLARGLPPGVAITWMLAAPVVNPLVLASTWVAFQGDWRMLVWRVLLVAAPALGLGLVLGRAPREALLRPGLLAPGLPHVSDRPDASACGHEHDHVHDHDHGHVHDHGPACACGGDELPATGLGATRPGRVLWRTGREFLGMGQFLVLGALASAAIKTWAPAGLLAAVSGSLPLAVAGMMLLAVLLSVCSEADAFVAASFTLFPTAAKAAFLALGPMVDLKLAGMYLATFRKGVALALVVAPTVLVWIGALAGAWLTGWGG
ncbi:MAG: permease [Desulfovibrionaceae bacterium]